MSHIVKRSMKTKIKKFRCTPEEEYEILSNVTASGLNFSDFAIAKLTNKKIYFPVSEVYIDKLEKIMIALRTIAKNSEGHQEINSAILKEQVAELYEIFKEIRKELRDAHC